VLALLVAFTINLATERAMEGTVVDGSITLAPRSGTVVKQ
jgi:hypothetical protein